MNMEAAFIFIKVTLLLCSDAVWRNIERNILNHFGKHFYSLPCKEFDENIDQPKGDNIYLSMRYQASHLTLGKKANKRISQMCRPDVHCDWLL